MVLIIAVMLVLTACSSGGQLMDGEVVANADSDETESEKSVRPDRSLTML